MMNQPDDPHSSYAPPRRGDDSFFWTVVSGLIFLYYGFYAPFIPPADPPVVTYAVIGFTWMARIVGVGMILVAILQKSGLPGASLINMVAAVLAALGCVVAGSILFMHQYTHPGFLMLAFGLLNIGSARAAIASWRYSNRQA